MSKASSVLAGAGLAALVLAFSGTADAASSGGSGGTSTPVCQSGFVYDPATKSCIKVDSELLDDERLLEEGRMLAGLGRYNEALGALTAVKDPNNSMVLTMIGYATRKLGDVDSGLAYYQQALTIDPNNADAREYLGEAYAESGRLDLARAELAKVEAICGTECEQYEDLAEAIELYAAD